MSSQIKVGYSVTVPEWRGTGVLTVTEDHGNEVTLSNGMRIYKAKCVPIWGANKSRGKTEAEKILAKKPRR